MATKRRRRGSSRRPQRYTNVAIELSSSLATSSSPKNIMSAHVANTKLCSAPCFVIPSPCCCCCGGGAAAQSASNPRRGFTRCRRDQPTRHRPSSTSVATPSVGSSGTRTDGRSCVHLAGRRGSICLACPLSGKLTRTPARTHALYACTLDVDLRWLTAT
jgi:hypothetical protein